MLKKYWKHWFLIYSSQPLTWLDLWGTRKTTDLCRLGFPTSWHASATQHFSYLWCAGVFISCHDVIAGRPVCRPGRHLLRVRGPVRMRASRAALPAHAVPRSLSLLCRTLVAGGRAAARSTVRRLVSQLWDLDIRHGSFACSFVVHSSIQLRCFGFLTCFDSFLIIKI